MERGANCPRGFPAIKELFNMKGFGAVFLALVSAAAGAAAAVYAMKKHEELEQYSSICPLQASRFTSRL